MKKKDIIIIAAVLNMINTTMTICTRFFSAISENVAANPVFFAILKVTTASALSDLDKIKLKAKTGSISSVSSEYAPNCRKK